MRTDHRRLTALVSDRNSPQKHVWRAEIVLLSADGVGTVEIMRRTGKSETCVWRWQERFAEEGSEELLRDKCGSRAFRRSAWMSPNAWWRSRSKTRPPRRRTGRPTYGEGSRHQRQRRPVHLEGARASAPPLPAVQALNDPKFVDKLRDVVGLYVDPPAHAIVLSVDEKSQIQALGPDPAWPAHEAGTAGHHDWTYMDQPDCNGLARIRIDGHNC